MKPIKELISSYGEAKYKNHMSLANAVLDICRFEVFKFWPIGLRIMKLTNYMLFTVVMSNLKLPCFYLLSRQRYGGSNFVVFWPIDPRIMKVKDYMLFATVMSNLKSTSFDHLPFPRYGGSNFVEFWNFDNKLWNSHIMLFATVMSNLKTISFYRLLFPRYGGLNFVEFRNSTFRILRLFYCAQGDLYKLPINLLTYSRA